MLPIVIVSVQALITFISRYPHRVGCVSINLSIFIITDLNVSLLHSVSNY
jgi:hypothetical protein